MLPLPAKYRNQIYSSVVHEYRHNRTGVVMYGAQTMNFPNNYVWGETIKKAATRLRRKCITSLRASGNNPNFVPDYIPAEVQRRRLRPEFYPDCTIVNTHLVALLPLR